MSFSSEQIARSTAAKLKQQFPDLPEIIEAKLTSNEPIQPESTSKSVEAIGLIIAIASFIIALAEFIISIRDRLKEDNEYKELPKPRQKREVVRIVMQEFSHRYSLDDELKTQIIEIQVEEVVE